MWKLTGYVSYKSHAVENLDVARSSRPVESADRLNEDTAEELVVLFQTIQILRRLQGNVRRSSCDTRSKKYQWQQFIHLPSHLVTRRVVAERNTEKQQLERRNELLPGKFSEQSVTWPCVASIFIGVHQVENPPRYPPLWPTTKCMTTCETNDSSL